MPHVFVETNWLFAYIAPAHHQVPAAAELVDRAIHGEFTLHLPNLCVGEARQAIRTKCQPRSEANALRRFLTFAAPEDVTEEEARIARIILDKYESSIKAGLDNLDDRLKAVISLPCVNTYALDEEMLAHATQLVLAGLTHKPFDQAVLASILVGAERLWDKGERGLSFCETDSDLQPWGRSGDTKTDLRAAYDNAHVWVYCDFALTQPARRPDFP